MNSHWKRWVIGGIVGAVVTAVGGPFVYIHFIAAKAPPPLTISTSTPAHTDSASTGGTVAVDGTWKVASGSLVGYRVNEILVGQPNVAAGRTSDVTGSITLSGTTVQ